MKCIQNSAAMRERREGIALSLSISTGGLLNEEELDLIIDAIAACDEGSVDRSRVDEAIACASASAAKRMGEALTVARKRRAKQRRHCASEESVAFWKSKKVA